MSQDLLWESVQGWHRNVKQSRHRVSTDPPSLQLSQEIAVDSVSSLKASVAKILLAKKLGGKEGTSGGLPICKIKNNKINRE